MINNSLKQLFGDTFLKSFETPWSGTLCDWAKQNISLHNNYAIIGNFDVSISRYLIEPLECLRNNNITQVNIVAATQTGKTLISEIYIPWIISQCPGPTLKLSQSDDMAKTAIESRLYPLLTNCKDIRKLLNEDSMTKGAIKLSNMYVKIAGAKENVLHGQSIQYLMMDEVWQYSEGVVEKAKARTTAFGNTKKIIISSQPGIEGDQLDKEHIKQAIQYFDNHKQAKKRNSKIRN